ncbi:alpha-1 adrenergic receptor [Plakobranchus ocellatus]|uniref:Alpha-1 adrenergic receptor n=1 Tax=Plakobranchus ocellatus TaxID=259542 RepID=A0AAV4ANB2_9GAST|nr:alpha-1 adrenergic receptor [Plakobranchus ocellatus]
MPLPIDTSEVLVMNYTVVVPTVASGYAIAKSPSISQTLDSLHYQGLSTTPYLPNNTTVGGLSEKDVGVTDYIQSGTDRPLLATILLAIALAIIVILTITGNVLVIASVALNSHLRTTTNYFIANLAIADLLLGTVVLPFSATFEVLQYWVFGQIFCGIWAAIDVLCCTASILSLCVISIDRYIGVTRPLQHARIMRHARAVYVIIFVWLLSVIISVAPLIGWKEEPHPDPRVCTVTTQPGYVLFSTAGSFYIPCLIILGVYFRIYRETVKYTRCLKAGTKTARVDQENVVSLRIHTGRNVNNGGSSNCQPPDSSMCSANEAMENCAVYDLQYGVNGGSHGHSGPRKGRSCDSGKRVSRLALSNKVARFKREKKAAKTLGIVVGVFITCWLPFFIILPLDSLCPEASVPPLLFKFFFWLGYCNSTMNPIIYTCSSVEFRRAFVSILCCSRCHRRQESSAIGMHRCTRIHNNGHRHGGVDRQHGGRHGSERQREVLELSLSKKSNSSGSSTFNATSIDHKSSSGDSPLPLDIEDVYVPEENDSSPCLRNYDVTDSCSQKIVYSDLQNGRQDGYKINELVVPDEMEMLVVSSDRGDANAYDIATGEFVAPNDQNGKMNTSASLQKRISFTKFSPISSSLASCSENDRDPGTGTSTCSDFRCTINIKSHSPDLDTNDLVKETVTSTLDSISCYSLAETISCSE